ncbi:MAG: HAMP domain-containing sensor histidine kinase [Candidatus Thiodiazotropha sp.]
MIMPYQSTLDSDWPELTGSVRDESIALAIGVFMVDGEMLYLNRGMQFLLGGDNPSQPRTTYLVNPSFSTFLDTPGDGEIFNGLLTVGDGLQINQTVKARVWRRDHMILISCEFDVFELDKLNRNLSRTNQRINNLERELVKKNIQLEETIATLRQTQSQLVEAEKMASFGAIVAGIAHEINTPAGIGLITASSLIRRTQELTQLTESDTNSRDALDRYMDAMREGLDLIDGSLHRIADLVSRFKQTSAKQSSEFRRQLELKPFLEDIVHSLGSRIDPKDVDINISCDDRLNFKTNPEALIQVFTNLLINSVDHGFKDGRKGSILISLEVKDETLFILYSDNGAGIAETDLERIYDPFFTTDIQQHTGLGLYLIYNLVSHKLKGRIQCESKPGQGVRFELRIPLRSTQETAKLAGGAI